MTKLRPRWQFALFGVIGFGLISLALSVGRACGIFEFTLEKLPGELLGAALPRPSDLRDWIVYFVLGGAFGLLYRKVFQILDRLGSRPHRGSVWQLDWRGCVLLGILQWLACGIVIALCEPHLTHDIALLPASPPLHSVVGMLLGLFILLVNCLFGVFMGLLAHLSRIEPGELAEIGPREEPSQESVKAA